MKKVVLTLTASLACLAAFAQGKISFQTDSLHLAYYDPVNGGSAAGNAISTANMPAGTTLVADLYMGSTSGSLQLISSTTFSATPGKWASASVVAPAPYTGGSTVFIVAQIRDNGHAAASLLDANLLSTGSTYAAALGYSWYGWSQEFQFTLGAGVTYPVMYNAPGWTQGTQDLSSSAGAGARGAIAVASVPEPTSMVLLGLGSAALLIFRRRK